MPKKCAPGTKANKTGDSLVKKKLNCKECGVNTVNTLAEMLNHKEWCPAVKAKNEAAAKAKEAAAKQKRKNR